MEYWTQTHAPVHVCMERDLTATVSLYTYVLQGHGRALERYLLAKCMSSVALRHCMDVYIYKVLQTVCPASHTHTTSVFPIKILV